MILKDVVYKEFDDDYFEQGVWGQMKRIALSQEGNVVGTHHPDNTDKWEDESDVDWEKYESDGWNCMVQIPKFYYKTYHGKYKVFEDVYRLEVSSIPKDGFKTHPAFTRVEGVTENYQYMGTYRGWEDEDGRLRSLPNKTATVSITIVDARIAAILNGNGEYYSQLDYLLVNAVQMLYLSEYGHWNAREKIGLSKSVSNTGLSNQNGNKTFGSSSYTSYRGIEKFYGAGQRQWCDGINIQNRQVYLAPNDFESDKFDGNYVKIDGAQMPTSNGFVANHFKFDGEYDWTFIPSSIDGATIDDHMSGEYRQSAYTRVAAFGGSNANAAGAFTWSFNPSSSSSNAVYGCRLQYLRS